MDLSSGQLRITMLLAICCVFIFGLVYRAPRHGASDTLWTLLVSQSIIEHQTIKLDSYKDAHEKSNPHHSFDEDYRVHERNGHYYYVYPVGTSVFSIPFVWAAMFMGLDMSNFEQEVATQGFISAVLCMLVFVTFYETCRCFVVSIASLVIAAISVLGSSLTSTMGAGLWSHNFTVIFIALSLLLLALHESGRIRAINPYLLGFLLFAAYLCRPTALVFILVVLAYLFFRHRTVLIRVVITLLSLLLLFAAWSWLEYGQMLPAYYTQSNRFGLTSTFWLGLYGSLLSPSRGILVFSPFFVMVAVGVVLCFRFLKTQALFWLTVSWFGLHVLLISSWDMWWGGYSYGPRLLTDVVPALVLITALLWRAVSQQSSLRMRTIMAGGYITLGLLGILINSYQGLYNIYTGVWNLYPDIDENPAYLYSWKYPQFLETGRSTLHRLQEHLDDYFPGEEITYTSNKALFIDWYEPATNEHWRWSRGTSPQIFLELDDIDMGGEYVAEMLLWSPLAQDVDVTLNGKRIGRLTLPAHVIGSTPETQSIVFNANLLKEGSLNTISFTISDPSIGLAFVSLKISPLSGDKRDINYSGAQSFLIGS